MKECSLFLLVVINLFLFSFLRVNAIEIEELEGDERTDYYNQESYYENKQLAKVIKEEQDKRSNPTISAVGYFIDNPVSKNELTTPSTSKTKKNSRLRERLISALQFPPITSLSNFSISEWSKETQEQKDLKKIKEIKEKIKDLEQKNEQEPTAINNQKENSLYPKRLIALKGDGLDPEGGALGAYQAAYEKEKKGIMENNNLILKKASLHRQRGALLERQFEMLSQQRGQVGIDPANSQLLANISRKAEKSLRKATIYLYKNDGNLFEESALFFNLALSELQKERPSRMLVQFDTRIGDILQQAATSGISAEESGEESKKIIYLKRKSALLKQRDAINNQKRFLSDSQKKSYWESISDLWGGSKDYHGAAQAYLEALSTDDPHERELRLKSGFHFEESANRMLSIDTLLKESSNYSEAYTDSYLSKKIANKWGGTDYNPGAASFHEKHRKASFQGRIYEAHCNKKASEASEKVARSLIEGNSEDEFFSTELVEVWRKLIKYSDPSLFLDDNQIEFKIRRVLETKAASLEQKNPVAVDLCNKSYTLLLELIEKLPALENSTSEIQEFKKEELLALEKQAEALEKQANAILSNNEILAELYSKVSEAWGGDEENPGVRSAYRWASYAKRKNYKIAQECEKSAYTFKKYATYLAQGDITEEKLSSLKKKAMIQGDYSNKKSIYRKAYLDHLEGNSAGSGAWSESAMYSELAAEEKDEGGIVKEKIYRQLSDLWGGEEDNPGVAYYEDLAFQARKENKEVEEEEYKRKVKEKKYDIWTIWKEARL